MSTAPTCSPLVTGSTVRPASVQLVSPRTAHTRAIRLIEPSAASSGLPVARLRSRSAVGRDRPVGASRFPQVKGDQGANRAQVGDPGTG
jgi:hypothetical protein